MVSNRFEGGACTMKRLTLCLQSRGRQRLVAIHHQCRSLWTQNMPYNNGVHVFEPYCHNGWGQTTTRLESMTAEVSALHEAMAGLHGEMGAVQRELEGAKTSQDKLAAGGRAGRRV